MPGVALLWHLPILLIVSLVHLLSGHQALARMVARTLRADGRLVQLRGRVAFVVADTDPRSVRDTLLRPAVARPAESDGRMVPGVGLRDLEIVFGNGHTIMR